MFPEPQLLKKIVEPPGLIMPHSVKIVKPDGVFETPLSVIVTVSPA